MGMREEMPIPLSMLSISFLDKLNYKGSYKGKRFMFEKVVDSENKIEKLLVYVWKDLYNFENTDEKDITKKEFTFDNNGIDEGIKFVEDFDI